MTVNIETEADPVASIIIPCYNREHLVKRAIESSLRQTVGNVEIIVVDDGSTDNSVLAIKSFGHQVRLISQQMKVQLLPEIVDSGRLKANSSYFWTRTTISKTNSMENLIKFAHSSDLVFGPFAFERSGELYNKCHPVLVSESLDFSHNWVSGHFVPTCSVLWRRSFVKAIGGWQNSALRNDDGEIILRAMILKARFSFADAGLGVYCHHDAPGRVSKRMGREVLCNQVEMLESLFKLAADRQFSAIGPVIGRAMYSIATEAFMFDADDIGEQALCRARRLGYRGHPGGWRHRASASVLGLRRKLKLARLVRSAPLAAVPMYRGGIAD